MPGSSSTSRILAVSLIGSFPCSPTWRTVYRESEKKICSQLLVHSQPIFYRPCRPPGDARWTGLVPCLPHFRCPEGERSHRKLRDEIPPEFRDPCRKH